MPREPPLSASIRDAIAALPPPSPRTAHADMLLRQRSCAGLAQALARMKATAHTDADEARLVYAVYAYVVDALVDEASAASDATWYWMQVIDDPWRCAVYWTQTIPHRVARTVCSVSQCGLRHWPILLPRAASRQTAIAKRDQLQETQEGIASTLGALALTWHSRPRDTSATRGLVQNACTALMPDGVRGKQHGENAAALLEAVAQHERRITQVLGPGGSGMPSGLTRMWPVLVFYPLFSWAATRYVSANWGSLKVQAQRAAATVRGLLVGWVYEPTMRLLDTLRTGQAGRRMLVSRDSLATDEKSLERMVASFGRDRLHLDAADVDAMVVRARAGNLTEVMELYERDMRAPLRSFLGGSFLRTVLIQVQKAKVDLEVALNGIDLVLRSQELVIGLVGLAPAVVLSYLLGRQALRLAAFFTGGAKAAALQRSGRNARLEAWEALRHIDRLVDEGQAGAHPVHMAPRAATEMQYGLLLLDIASLRESIAEVVSATFPTRPTFVRRVRDGCASDLAELETIALPTDASPPLVAWDVRRAIVDRMWRSWSSVISLRA
ncbi:Nuclear control of ATPase protein 2 [Malassezia sp. CBS 17886]|nr:Nuclear control of ATPase protein 2 [Malassezia sp. CBS 17886]